MTYRWGKPVAEGAESPDVDPFLGRTLADKYVVESFVGGGSMGAVYRARQIALHRVVAIKVMYPELATDREFAARFRREAHAASRLAHVNSITITDFGEEPDGLLYLVMEYVDGPSLEDLLEGGEPLPEERIVDIMSQILSALAAAHDAGIVHRDLKPANVLVVQKFDDDGYPIDHVKVCDFGVASLRDVAVEGAGLRPSQDGLGAVSMAQALEARKGGARPLPKALTMAGAVVGTPAYMSPEQASGRPQDARSDLYSLGVVLYELITRQLPFDGATAEELMARHIAATPPSPADLVPCHPKLAEVCLRALQKKPEARFPNARAMRAELRSVYQLASLGDVPTQYPPSVGPRSGSPYTTGSIRVTPASSMRIPRNAMIPRETLAESAPDSMREEFAGQATHDGLSTARPERVAKPKWPYAIAALLLAGGVLAFVLRPAPVTGSAPPVASESHVDVVPSASAAPTPVASLDVPTTPLPVAPASVTTSKNTPPARTTGKLAASGPEETVVPPPAVVVPPPVVPPPVVPPPGTPSATPQAPPPPVAPPFVPDHGRVRVAVASVSRIQRTSVLSAVQRIDVNDCYRNTLRSLGHAEGGAGSVTLDIDEDGVIAGAVPKLPGPLGSASGCIAGKIRGQRLPAPPDTGSAGAVLSLTFEP